MDSNAFPRAYVINTTAAKVTIVDTAADTDVLLTHEKNTPILPIYMSINNIIKTYLNNAVHSRPPTTNDTARKGSVAITYINVVTIAESSLPATIENGFIGVVSIISRVCLSRSPETDVDVMIGIIRPIIPISHIASTGNILAIFA